MKVVSTGVETPSTPEGRQENELVRTHSRLVKTIIYQLRRRIPPHVDSEDLYSAGMLGLLNAIRQYDENVGSPFSAYASLRVRGAILDELRSMDWASRSVRKKIRRVQTVRCQLEKAKGAAPTDEETAEALEMPLPTYRRLQTQLQPMSFVSLEAMMEASRGIEAHPALADRGQQRRIEEVVHRESLKRILNADVLSHPQKTVIRLLYVEGLRCEEIAPKLNVSQPRISQIHAAAIRAIRGAMNGKRYQGSTAGRSLKRRHA